MHKKYPSKLGLEIVLPIVIVFATIIVLAAFDDQGWVVLSIISPIAVFIAYTFLNTYYIIQDDNLIIKSGFIYHQKICINSITKIESTKSIVSAPAISLDRIEISFNKFDQVIISPKHKQEFIAHLVEINPDINIKPQATTKTHYIAYCKTNYYIAFAMTKIKPKTTRQTDGFIKQAIEMVQAARQHVVRQTNSVMVFTYFQIGKIIIEN